MIRISAPALSSKVKLDMAVLKTGLAALAPGVPHTIFLGLTSRCDLACSHCKYAAAQSVPEKKDMPRALLRRLLAEAAGAGIPRVAFFGGEPLLYAGLEEAVAAASGLGLFTELDTNGQTLTPARAKTLAAAGLSAVMISLHSHSPARHDALSGPGSFKLAAAALLAARNAGLITYISSCVFSGSLSAGELQSLLAYARKAGAHGARVLAYAPPSGASRLPAELAAGLRRASLDGYARTCARPGGGACAATQGEVIFVDPGGEVRSCPYAAESLGRGGRLGRFLGRRSRPGRFPCQKPR